MLHKKIFNLLLLLWLVCLVTLYFSFEHNLKKRIELEQVFSYPQLVFFLLFFCSGLLIFLTLKVFIHVKDVKLRKELMVNYYQSKYDITLWGRLNKRYGLLLISYQRVAFVPFNAEYVYEEKTIFYNNKTRVSFTNLKGTKVKLTFSNQRSKICFISSLNKESRFVSYCFNL